MLKTVPDTTVPESRDPNAGAGSDIGALAFVGAVIPESMGLGSRAFNVAGNKFQLNLLEALNRRVAGSVSILSIEPAPVFPGGDRLLFSNRHCDVPEKDLSLQLIPFVNVVGIKEASIASSIFLRLLRWLWASRGSPRTIIVFNVFSPFALSVLAAAALGGAKPVAIVADLPHDYYKFRGIKGLFERLDLFMQTRLLRTFAGLVALTKEIGEDFAPHTPMLVVEGGVNPDEMRVPEVPDPLPASAERVCLFSGTLNEINGIRLLLDGFALVRDPDCRLWIFGDGELRSLVVDAAARDPRIVYWGMVPNSEVLRRQREATILLNPRPSHQDLIRYTFPSKLLEYMASGRPVLTTALSGIPDEYYTYLFRIRRETPEGLASTIEAALARGEPELAALGARARRFVLEQKSWARQAERIQQFIQQLWAEEPDR